MASIVGLMMVLNMKGVISELPPPAAIAKPWVGEKPASSR